MQSELHRNNMYQSVELLLLVPMLFLLSIPKCLQVFQEIFITLVYYYQPILTSHSFSSSWQRPSDRSVLHLSSLLTVVLISAQDMITIEYGHRLQWDAASKCSLHKGTRSGLKAVSLPKLHLVVSLW